MRNESNLYPLGYIDYAFKMYVSYDKAISCSLERSNVRELLLKKANPANKLDPEWRMTIHFGNVQSVKDLDEAGNAIKDEVFDMLTFILNTKITEIRLNDHGLIRSPGEGPMIVGRAYKTEIGSSMKHICSSVSDKTVQKIQTALSGNASSRPDLLIKLFRHAIDSDHPVVQFLMLYQILEVLYADQTTIDNQIRSIEPDTLLSISPRTRQPETVYSRLRNEINHGLVCPKNTENEITNYLQLFRSYVHKILQTTLDLENATSLTAPLPTCSNMKLTTSLVDRFH